MAWRVHSVQSHRRIENIHEHILMYFAKKFAYTYPVYKARNYLACIGYKAHKDREVLKNKKGEIRLHRMFSKKTNNWTCYIQKQPKKYEYIPNGITYVPRICTCMNLFFSSNCYGSHELEEIERLVLDQQVLELGPNYHREMLGRKGQKLKNAKKMMRQSACRNFTL